jgi:hypothetical protein
MPAEKFAKGKEARALIDTWKPDLIYTSDDDAQEHVAKHYVNSGVPIVFSGVNKHPRTYGFEGSHNVTGVLEHEHFIESLRLVRAMVPDARRVAAVFDDAPMWDPVARRMRERRRCPTSPWSRGTRSAPMTSINARSGSTSTAPMRSR